MRHQDAASPGRHGGAGSPDAGAASRASTSNLNPIPGRSVTVTGNVEGSFIVTGDHNTIVLESIQTPTVPAQTLWNVPHRSLCFTGRQDVLEELHEDLARSKSVALVGLPGVGKTQLAVEYAHRHLDDYAVVFWVTADTRDALSVGFASIARLLDLPVKDEHDQNVVIDAVKRWLQSGPNWLLILDNVDDLGMVREFLPSGGPGCLLMTTRLSSTGEIWHRTELQKMSREEGARLLLRRANLLGEGRPWDAIPVDDRDAALAIAENLDGLPLALDQAGAFIEATPSSPAEYLAFYETERAELLAARPEGSSYAHESVTTTFSLVFKKVADANRAAADLLCLCAFLAPDAIPEEIIIHGAPDLGEVLGAAASQRIPRSRAIGEACRFSLLDREPRERTFTIHRLVQVVLQDGMDETARSLWAGRAVRAVGRTFPVPEFCNWSACHRLMPQIHACAELVKKWRLEFPEAASLLNSAGNCLRDRGQYAKVDSLYRRALAIREKSFGQAHPDVAATLNDLGVYYYCNGRYVQAETQFRHALEIREQALGPEHADVAVTLNDLAVLYRRQGRYADAEPLFRHALAIRQASLGQSHPLVAETMNGLADVYDDQGRYSDAERLCEQALEIREGALGAEHPRVADSLNCLAIVHRNQGHFLQAERLYQRALAIRRQTLGEQHPTVAASLINLAGLHYDQSNYHEAETLLEEALAIQEKALGPDHPELAANLHGLAELHRQRGDYKAAEALYRRALEIQEKALGTQHSDVATTLHGLGELYAQQGCHAKAEPLLQRALTIREATLVPESPDIQETRMLLADVRLKHPTAVSR